MRVLAKDARSGEPDEFEQLRNELSSMPLALSLPVARAFAHFLNLANVAEQHHRGRRRRAHRRDPSAQPQRGSCEDAFERLLAAGISTDELYEAVTSLRIELVLTAHPTEVSRRTLVEKYNRIAELLSRRDGTDLTPEEQDAVTTALRREIMTAWGTNEIRDRKPTAIDEVRGDLVLFEHPLWDALPRYARELDRALTASTGRSLPIEATPICFGSWIGGDRDGNPNVTPEITRQTCLRHRWVATDLYVRELDALRGELSLSAGSPALSAVGGAPEPYRALLRGVRARMAATRTWLERSFERHTDSGEDVYLDAEPLAAALQLCHESLIEHRQELIAGGRLTDRS